MKLTILLALMMSCLVGVSAQNNLEIGIFGGTSTYFGDLQQGYFEKDMMHRATGVFMRLETSPIWAFKLHGYKAKISGNDANYPELESVWQRNLSFQSDIYELGFQAEMTLISFGENRKKLAAPYLFAGVSAFYFNPKAKYDGQWVDLQPLGTEGQGWQQDAGNPYSRLQIAIPIGIGFRVRITERINIGFECGFRKTFTDYLDDVSKAYPNITQFQEQNPMGAALSFRSHEVTDRMVGEDMSGQLRGSDATDDIYFIGGVTISTVLGKLR